MIRIVYRWKVGQGNQAAFRTAWDIATTAIRDNTEGARGSILLEGCDDPTDLITIAHWDSLEQWTSFIRTTPEVYMKRLHELAELVSMEAFRQVGDRTV